MLEFAAAFFPPAAGAACAAARGDAGAVDARRRGDLQMHDNAGRVTYQQAPCPATAGGRVELFIDNGSSRGAPDDEAQWQAAVRDHVVVVGMPRHHVVMALVPHATCARADRARVPPRCGRIPAMTACCARLRARGCRVAATDAGGADVSPQDLARAAARGEVARGQSCIQVLSDIGNATSEEDVAQEPGTVSRRYIWEPVPGDANMRTTVLCINGQVAEVERQNVP
jgi:hypothetical protein